MAIKLKEICMNVNECPRKHHKHIVLSDICKYSVTILAKINDFVVHIIFSVFKRSLPIYLLIVYVSYVVMLKQSLAIKVIEISIS